MSQCLWLIGMYCDWHVKSIRLSFFLIFFNLEFSSVSIIFVLFFFFIYFIRHFCILALIWHVSVRLHCIIINGALWMYIVVDFPPLPRSAPPPLPPSRPPVPPRGVSQPVHHHHHQQQQVRQMSSMHIVAEEWQESSSYYASSAVAYGSFPASLSNFYGFD